MKFLIKASEASVTGMLFKLGHGLLSKSYEASLLFIGSFLPNITMLKQGQMVHYIGPTCLHQYYMNII